MANEEDDCKGRFWEGRFKSQALLDEAAVLACMAYVDLNPVRVGISDLPERSDFTSIQQRIALLAERGVGRPVKVDVTEVPKPMDINRRTNKQTKQTKVSTVSLEQEQPVLYPFNQGFALKDDEEALPFFLVDYLELIDWTGRARRADKAGAIPEQAPSILSRLGLTPSAWLQFVPEVEKSFTHVVGNSEALKQLATRFKRSWLRGQGVSTMIYQSAGSLE